MFSLARILILTGIILVVLGGLILLFNQVNLPFGKLPGDIKFERGNSTCIIALGTSILLSIVLTILLNVFAKLWR